METSDDRAAAQWVDDRFAGVVVPSDQQPDPRRVFDRILARHEQRRRRRRTLLYAGCSAIAVLLVIGALPSTRLVAQRVWKKLQAATGVAVVREPEPDITAQGALHFEYTSPKEPAEEVRTVEEAAERAGFVPRLPNWRELGEQSGPGEMRLGVSGARSARIKINVLRLRQVVRQQRNKDVDIPDAWDGVELVSEISPTILAAFGNDHILLTQSLPFAVSVPAGFDLDQLWDLLDPDWRRKFEPNKVAAALPPDVDVDVQQVTLKSGKGTLIKNNTDHETGTFACFFCPVQPHELVLIWFVPDREYALRSDSLTAEEAIRLANAIR